MASDAEHLFVCLFAICMSFFVKCLSYLLPISQLIVLWAFRVPGMSPSPWTRLQTFLGLRLVLTLPVGSFLEDRYLILTKSTSSVFLSFMACAFGIMSINSPPGPGSQDFSVIFNEVFYFYKYLIYFELVFVLDIRFRITSLFLPVIFWLTIINFKMQVRNFTLFICLLEIILLFCSHFQDFILIHVYPWGSFIVTLSYSSEEKKAIGNLTSRNFSDHIGLSKC